MAEEWFEEAFGKKTPEDEIKSLKDSLAYQRQSFQETIKSERGFRAELAKRVRKLERLTALLVQTVLMTLGFLLFSEIGKYWEKGEWWQALAIIALMVFIVKAYHDAEKGS